MSLCYPTAIIMVDNGWVPCLALSKNRHIYSNSVSSSQSPSFPVTKCWHSWYIKCSSFGRKQWIRTIITYLQVCIEFVFQVCFFRSLHQALERQKATGRITSVVWTPSHNVKRPSFLRCPQVTENIMFIVTGIFMPMTLEIVTSVSKSSFCLHYSTIILPTDISCYVCIKTPVSHPFLYKRHWPWRLDMDYKTYLESIFLRQRGPLVKIYWTELTSVLNEITSPMLWKTLLILIACLIQGQFFSAPSSSM